jgi:glycosyltransferase involved in cell wall biosynthesis
LESIRLQSFENWEAICVIDGSPDQSVLTCKRYAEIDKRFKIVEQKNQGLAAARNNGLIQAKGKFVHFVDPDDRLPNTQVYRNMHRIIIENNCDIVIGKSKYFQNTFNRFVEDGTGYNLIKENYNSLSFVLENKFFFALTSGVNKLYRRAFLIDNNLFWPSVSNEDDRWLPKVMNCSENIVFTTEELYDVRRRAESLTSIRNNTHMRRRGLGYMQTALENLELVSKANISNVALKNGTEYYIQLYFTGLKMNRDYMGRESGTNDIIPFMKNSGNLKMRGIYILSLIFGKNFALKIMKRRYKIG